jgi:hypothetical protein
MNLNDLSQHKRNYDEFNEEETTVEPAQTSLAINCLICGKINNRDIRNDNELIANKMMIIKCIPCMFTEIKKETNDGIEKLQSMFLNQLIILKTFLIFRFTQKSKWNN